ncbi:hypothetical protein NDN08_001432 [Rhodosorus marinus]|uniref:Nascent polypeptide-associated complex subunit alpha-like UBA domain-containing protein n=1 Tax=Rhodosorus marinus TaxID=101924 RepID=A0AAV8UTK7_9RHOD|nr:hypothetical protein NDN08_001432 [Rhodosorus marinus]
MEDEAPEKDKDRETAKSNKDLGKVTDFVAEREVDAEKFRHAITGILDSSSKDNAEKVKREKELAAVKINSEDVEVIMKEFDMDRASSERCLREQSGNLVDALRTLVE